MFKYQFECSNEQTMRTKFENLKACDRPRDKGFWGNNLYGKGIHFEECEERITGFYINSSEGDIDGINHGSPIRTHFNGTFKQNGDKTVFEVYIYPSPLEILFFIIAAIFISIYGDLIGIILAVAVFSFFGFGYYSNIKKTVEEFKIIIR